MRCSPSAEEHSKREVFKVQQEIFGSVIRKNFQAVRTIRRKSRNSIYLKLSGCSFTGRQKEWMRAKVSRSSKAHTQEGQIPLNSGEKLVGVEV